MSEEANRAWKDQYMLRLPDGMRDRIKAAAEANNRSMNAEIVHTLSMAYAPETMPSRDRQVPDALLEEMTALMLKYYGPEV